METDRLANCPICGKLYVKYYADCCPECHQEIEKDFLLVKVYLKNADAANVTLPVLSEATGVTVKRIANFIREGRIYGADFPNLGYACAHCGTMIQRHWLCYACLEMFSSDINRSLKRDELVEGINKKQGNPASKEHFCEMS